MGISGAPSLLDAVLGETVRTAGQYLRSTMTGDSQTSMGGTTNISNMTGASNIFRHPAPASSTKTVRRHKLKNGNSKGIDPHDVKKYPPLTIAIPKQSLQLKSPFAQFKKWFDGSTTLKNSFSFVMGSEKGKRGCLLIPLRTDACVYGTFSSMAITDQTSDNYNRFCTGEVGGGLALAKAPRELVDKMEHWGHVVGDLMRTGKDGSTVCQPYISANPGSDADFTQSPPVDPVPGSTSGQVATSENTLIPGMQLLHLEATSWSLNNCKVVKQLPIQSNAPLGSDLTRQELNSSQPLYTHGNWNPQKYNGWYPERPDNYISRRLNGARQQNMLVATKLKKGTNNDPNDRPDDWAYAPFEEQYEVQCGHGSIEYTIFNEGPTQATVELVLFKPNKNCFAGDTSNSPDLDNLRYSPRFVENAWSWLKTVNGENFKQSVYKNREKVLQTNAAANSSYAATDNPKNSDIINNPYVNFLPESSFRNISQNAGAAGRNPQQSMVSGINNPIGNIMDNGLVDTGATAPDSFNDTGFGEDVLKGAGRVMQPYSHVGRGFAVVPPQSKRTIRIPLPKMRYNPSRDTFYTKLDDDFTIGCKYLNANGDAVDMMPTIMNPQSIMCAISVNGAMQDYFEDTPTKPGVFRGQDFTPSAIYVDAVYREKVYPCAMEDCNNGVSFNFGSPMGTNLGTADYYPGQVIDQRNVVPVNTGTTHRTTTTIYKDSAGNQVPANDPTAETAETTTEERQSGVKRTVNDALLDL